MSLCSESALRINQFEEEDSGLIYMGARYYDPQVGRFLTPDPVSQLTSIETNPMMVNRYAYANNNPISYTDPDGNNPKLILDFALNVSINMLLTGQPGFANAAVETAKGAINPFATISKVKKLTVAIRAANQRMAQAGKGVEAAGDAAKGKIHGHHSDPKFLGGDPKQSLTEMDDATHRALHKDMNDFLRTKTDEFGNHMRPQRGNSGEKIKQNFTRS